MEDKVNQKASVANPKLGSDGLTKKERRALKVAAEGKKKDFEKPNLKSETKKDNPIPITKSQNEPAPDTNNTPAITQNSTEIKGNVKELSKAELKAQRKAEHEAKFVKETDVKETEVDKSKAELKAQRRALQETQRLAKVQKEKEIVPDKPKQKSESKLLKPTPQSNSKHTVFLFNHLYENYTSRTLENTINVGVHSAFVKLGTQYSSKTILGSNARCFALLSALKSLVEDFRTPPKQEFCRSLESTLQMCVLHLQHCRPLAVSMMNALRHFKLHLTKIDSNLSDGNKRTKLLDCIEMYIQDEIAKAGEAISIQVINKIDNDDVILIYGCSSLIRRILLDAHNEGKKFKVIVVDSHPLLEGTKMLQNLVLAGIPVTYVLINAASFIMSRATKVLLGAHALLANGYVMSRNGTAQIALIARAYNIPVLVCCETYKFCERVQTDSFVYNEIGDPDELVKHAGDGDKIPLKSWRDKGNLTPLNLMYDVTPPDLVTAVVTELAILPCTSVPVILRIRPSEFI